MIGYVVYAIVATLGLFLGEVIIHQVIFRQ